MHPCTRSHKRSAPCLTWEPMEEDSMRLAFSLTHIIARVLEFAMLKQTSDMSPFLVSRAFYDARTRMKRANSPWCPITLQQINAFSQCFYDGAQQCQLQYLCLSMDARTMRDLPPQQIKQLVPHLKAVRIWWITTDQHVEYVLQLAMLFPWLSFELECTHISFMQLDLLCSSCRLTQLYVYSSPLHHLPESLSMSTRLDDLYLYNCQLEELPDYLGTFKQLRWLDVFRNNLKSLPACLLRCLKLTYVWARNNPLTDFANVDELRQRGVEIEI